MSKKQFIGRATKNWSSDDGHDWEEKNRMINLLRSELALQGALFDETIFVNKTTFKWQREQPKNYPTKEALLLCWEIFKPDIIYPKFNLIIEMDGDFHFNTKKGVKRTTQRNQYYEYAEFKFVWYYSGNDNKEGTFMNLTDQEILAKFRQNL